jgi:hypothetical protein
MTRKIRQPKLGEKWQKDLPAVAQIYAGMWARGLAKQHDRVIAGADDPELQVIDAMLYLNCLRNLMRAADLADDVLSPGDFGAAARALEAFKLRCPWVDSARNWIEHFDEYALGLGRDPKVKRYQTPLRVRLLEDAKGHKFKLTAGGRSLVIDMVETTDAGVDLWLDLVQADDIVAEFGGVDPTQDGASIAPQSP